MKIYTAPSEQDAQYYLEVFREKWDGKYPQISKSWDENWVKLSAFFKYSEEVHKIIDLKFLK